MDEAQGRACVYRKGVLAMVDPPGKRRRAAAHITRPRASRLYSLIRFLEGSPRSRDDVLKELAIGLRTFYRELDLLKRCGVKVKHSDRLYVLATAPGQAGGRLPFPDPQLTFAEMEELAQCESEAGRRLAALLASVVDPSPARQVRKHKRGSR